MFVTQYSYQSLDKPDNPKMTYFISWGDTPTPESLEWGARSFFLHHTDAPHVDVIRTVPIEDILPFKKGDFVYALDNEQLQKKQITDCTINILVPVPVGKEHRVFQYQLDGDYMRWETQVYPDVQTALIAMAPDDFKPKLENMLRSHL